MCVLGGAAIADQAAAEARPFELRVTRARKIYSDGRHNAFTGMARLGERTFVTFRSAVNHLTLDGRIRVIASEDLRSGSRSTWRSGRAPIFAIPS